MNNRLLVTNLKPLFTLCLISAFAFLVACDDSEETDPCENFALSVSGSETEITLDITAGTAPYSYEIAYTGGETQSGTTSSATTTVVASVLEGATITLTDAESCTTTATLADGALSDPCEDLTIAVSGEGTEITLTITEGTAPFDYVITYTGETTQEGTTSDEETIIEATVFEGAEIAVTDASGCTETVTLNEGALSDPCADFSFTVEGDDEDVVFNITAGTAPYDFIITYLSDGTQSGQVETATASVEADAYEAGTVTLTDANGCETTADLADPCLSFSFEVDVIDNGTVIEFDIDEGIAPYDYVIVYDDDENTEQEGQLAEGDEEVVVEVFAAATIYIIDARSCSTELELEEGELIDPCTDFEVAAIGSDGEITMTIEEGTAPFDYTITYTADGGATVTQSDTDVTDREFTIAADETVDASIVVTDANGCETSATVTEDDLNSFYDFRGEGQRYGMIEINGLIWLSENFNFDDGSGECYDNDEDNCNEYGKLYTWTAATADDFAPEGWRLPTNDEVIALGNYLGANGGETLKEEDGFGAKLAGGIGTDGFTGLGDLGVFWTGEEADADEAYRYFVEASTDNFYTNVTLFKTLSFSVRLVKE